MKSSMKNLTIQKKIIIWFSVTLIVIVALMNTLTFAIANLVLDEDVKERLMNTVASNVEEIEYFNRLDAGMEREQGDQFLRYNEGWLEIDDDFCDFFEGICTALYDENGNLTTDPAQIEKTWRVLPMGYWKGSGISIALDMIATILTNGNSVQTIGTFGDEVGLSQVMIAIDPSKGNTPEQTEEIVNAILADIKSSIPVTEGGEVLYPGEREARNIDDFSKNGIPVVEEVWNSILAM